MPGHAQIQVGQLWAPRHPDRAVRTAEVTEYSGVPGSFVTLMNRRTGRSRKSRDTNLLEQYRPVTGPWARECRTCQEPGPPCPGAEGCCPGRGQA